MAKRKSNPDATGQDKPADSAIPIIDLGASYSEPSAENTHPIIDVSQLRDGDEPFLGINEGEQKKTRKPYTKRKKEDSGELPMIDGEMLLMFIDILIPMIITTASNQITGTKVSPDDISLTEKQKGQMKRLADKCAERIDINVNPFLGLIVGVGGIYAMNYMNATKEKI